MEKSVFYATDKINKMLLELEDENILYEDGRQNIPFYTPFIEQKKIFIDLWLYIALRCHLSYYMQMLQIFIFFKVCSQSKIFSSCC